MERIGRCEVTTRNCETHHTAAERWMRAADGRNLVASAIVELKDTYLTNLAQNAVAQTRFLRGITVNCMVVLTGAAVKLTR